MTPATTKPAPTLQDQIIRMVRLHQGLTIPELKARMHKRHGTDPKQTENTIARLRRTGQLENRSATATPLICTPGCATMPANSKPAATAKNKRPPAAATTNPGHPSPGTSGPITAASPLCQPTNTPSELLRRIEAVLLQLPPGEYISALDVATRLGMQVDVMGVRSIISGMVYRFTVLSRLSADRKFQTYRLTPERTAKLTEQASTNTEGSTNDDGPANRWIPPKWEPPRAQPPGWVEPPSLRDGVRVPYGGIKSMCTGAGSPTGYNTARLKQ